MFTYHYSQPNAYRFSLDSIHLAELVAKQIQSRHDLSDLRVLDLCAGCGVIGIELSWYVRELRDIHFIEVQDIYKTHFQENVQKVNRPELKLHWHQLNYDVLQTQNWESQFDIIISNPPYFLSGQGMLSPSQFKNRCRFFIDSSFENFILSMLNSLAEGGQAYFLLRPLHQHGSDLFSDVQHLLQGHPIKVRKLCTIRGTDVVLLEK